MKTTRLFLCLALAVCSAAPAAELLWQDFDSAPTGSVAALPGWSRASWLGGLTGRVFNVDASHPPFNTLELVWNVIGSSAVFTNFNSAFNPANEHPVIRCSAKLHCSNTNAFFQLGLRDSKTGKPPLLPVHQRLRLLRLHPPRQVLRPPRPRPLRRRHLLLQPQQQPVPLRFRLHQPPRLDHQRRRPRHRHPVHPVRLHPPQRHRPDLRPPADRRRLRRDLPPLRLGLVALLPRTRGPLRRTARFLQARLPRRSRQRRGPRLLRPRLGRRRRCPQRRRPPPTPGRPRRSRPPPARHHQLDL